MAVKFPPSLPEISSSNETAHGDNFEVPGIDFSPLHNQSSISGHAVQEADNYIRI